MDKQKLFLGDVVQLSNNCGDFSYCFMVVTEPKPWGAMGYVQNAGAKGQAFYRATFENMDYVGKAYWTLKEDN